MRQTVSQPEDACDCGGRNGDDCGSNDNQDDDNSENCKGGNTIVIFFTTIYLS